MFMVCRVLLCVLLLRAEATRVDSGEYVLQGGDTYTCEEAGHGNVTFTLESDMLGEGLWGGVFKTVGGKYAVKVERSAAWKERDRFSMYKDYEHECGIMRALEGVEGVRVPRCLALCHKDGLAILVMDLVRGAEDMRHAPSLDEDALYQAGVQVFTSTMAMVGPPVYRPDVPPSPEGVVNVDQRDVNILTEPDGTVRFIDMGMAHRPSEEYRMCDDGKNKMLKVLKDLAALGVSRACDIHVEWQYVNTVSSTLGALPTGSEAAMRGMVDAFCEAPHNELTRTRYWKVTPDRNRDKLFMQAFLGKTDFLDELVEPPLLEKRRDGGWYKVGDTPIRVTRGRSNAESHQVRAGAKLVAVQLNGQYGSMQDPEDMRYWRPGSKGQDLLEGDYIFILPDEPMVAEVILNTLERARMPALQARARSCAGMAPADIES